MFGGHKGQLRTVYIFFAPGEQLKIRDTGMGKDRDWILVNGFQLKQSYPVTAGKDFLYIYMFISTFVLYKIRIALSLKISTGWTLDSIRTTPEDQSGWTVFVPLQRTSRVGQNSYHS